jgi:hypothetical protein
MHKLCVYIPQEHLDIVKEALFASGAGVQGNYSHCCWQTLGTGQFKPLDGSSPFMGEQDCVEYVQEYRVEMLVSDDSVKAVVAALRLAHPYEEPAFDFIKVADV